MFIHPFLNAVIENKQFPLNITKQHLVWRNWNWSDLNLFMCIFSFFEAAPLIYFGLCWAFLRKEYEQPISSKGTVLCAVSGLHDKQLNHLLTEASNILQSACLLLVLIRNTMWAPDPHAHAQHPYACTHTSWITLDPPASPREKIIYISESALSCRKKNPQALFTWGEDELQKHTEDNGMKNINHHKNISPYSCPRRCEREPDRERTKLRGEKEKEERIEVQSG